MHKHVVDEVGVGSGTQKIVRQKCPIKKCSPKMAALKSGPRWAQGKGSPRTPPTPRSIPNATAAQQQHSNWQPIDTHPGAASNAYNAPCPPGLAIVSYTRGSGSPTGSGHAVRPCAVACNIMPFRPGVMHPTRGRAVGGPTRSASVAGTHRGFDGL